jgi:Gpi18-like mannosyltransferase
MFLIRAAVICTVLTFIVVLLPYMPAHQWDAFCWREWTLSIHRSNLHSIYFTGADYPPLYHYILWLYGMLSGSEKAIIGGINNLRICTLIFDVVGLWFVYKWTGKKVEFYLLFLLCILNISYSYNTLIWGQIDGILATLIFLSLYFGYNKNIIASAVCFILALNFKLQAIVFFPVWGLLFADNFIGLRNIKKGILSLFTIVALQILILIPFILYGGLEGLWRIVTGSVDKFPFLVMGAKNIWTLVFNGNAEGVLDSGVWFWDVTYKQAGLLMFFSASLIVLLPFLLRVIKRIKNPKTVAITREQLWLTSALISMLFYFLNTQMHERYVHPAFVFILAYAISKKDFIPLVLFSIAYLLNLEAMLGALHLRDNNTFLLNDVFIAILYVIEIVYLSVKLFLLYKWKPRDKHEEIRMPLLRRRLAY